MFRKQLLIKVCSVLDSVVLTRHVLDPHSGTASTLLLKTLGLSWPSDLQDVPRAAVDKDFQHVGQCVIGMPYFRSTQRYCLYVAVEDPRFVSGGGNDRSPYRRVFLSLVEL